MAKGMGDGAVTDLLPLAVHERRVFASLNALGPKANGIACPGCGAELMDTSPWRVLQTNPPSLNIHCDSCNFLGTRIF